MQNNLKKSLGIIFFLIALSLFAPVLSLIPKISSFGAYDVAFILVRIVFVGLYLFLGIKLMNDTFTSVTLVDLVLGLSIVALIAFNVIKAIIQPKTVGVDIAIIIIGLLFFNTLFSLTRRLRKELIDSNKVINE